MKNLTILIGERQVILSVKLTAALLSQILDRHITAVNLVVWDAGRKPMPADVAAILKQIPTVE